MFRKLKNTVFTAETGVILLLTIFLIYGVKERGDMTRAYLERQDDIVKLNSKVAVKDHIIKELKEDKKEVEDRYEICLKR